MHRPLFAELLQFVLPPGRLLDAIAEESDKEGRGPAHDKHESPFRAGKGTDLKVSSRVC